jgi:indole-3-glycerol phosphate synthase
VLNALGETGADAIGVNNRDLKTLEVSLETSLALVERIPASVVRVAESGIATADDIDATAWRGV